MLQKAKVIFVLFLSVSVVQGAWPYDESEEESNSTFPTKMTFHETKTNYMLGEALLKRIYKRIEHLEDMLKADMSRGFEKLRDQFHKNFRKCDVNLSRKGDGNQTMYGFSGDMKQGKKGRKQRDKKGKRKEKIPVTEGSYPHGYVYFN